MRVRVSDKAHHIESRHFVLDRYVFGCRHRMVSVGVFLFRIPREDYRRRMGRRCAIGQHELIIRNNCNVATGFETDVQGGNSAQIIDFKIHLWDISYDERFICKLDRKYRTLSGFDSFARQAISQPRLIGIRANDTDADHFQDERCSMQATLKILAKYAQVPFQILKAVLYFSAAFLLSSFGLSTIQFRAPLIGMV